MDTILKVENLQKSYNKLKVLDGISFELPRGKILVVMGGSGCGKSTLLRQLTGQETSTHGDVWLFGKKIHQLKGHELDQLRLRFGVLFQSGALFNSLTVGENIALVLQENTDLAEETIRILVKMKLEVVGLRAFEHHYPMEISGGMKKRAGLARALALGPELIFYDEPESGLDPIMAAVIDQLIFDLNRRMGVSAVVVTHDVKSAFRLADNIIILFQGKILVSGTPQEIQNCPDPLVQQFIHGEAVGPSPMNFHPKDYLKDLMGEGN